MESRSIEVKVGIFVLIAIVAAAVMIVKFGKGNFYTKDSYTVVARFAEVGGIIRGAKVYYLGVDVGRVADITIDDTANKVNIVMAIQKSIPIPTGSRFEIRQVGLLGDKVIAIVPTARSTVTKPLENGAVVEGIVPLDLANLSERAGELATRIGEFADNMNAVIKRLNTELLDAQTLVNTKAVVANAATVTRETAEAIREIKELLRANRAAIDTAMANIATISADVQRTAKRFDSLVAENSPSVTASVSNITVAADNLRSLTEKLSRTAGQIDSLLEKIERGEGALGLLMSDPKARQDLQKMIDDLAEFSVNLRKWGPLRYRDGATDKPREKTQEQTERKPAGGNRGVIYRRPSTQSTPDKP